MLLSYHHPELLLTKDLMMCAQLSSRALGAPFARDLLTFLGFDFQKDGARDKDPFVVFPHWDPDGTLFMASQVLEAACGKYENIIVVSHGCASTPMPVNNNSGQYLTLLCERGNSGE